MIDFIFTIILFNSFYNTIAQARPLDDNHLPSNNIMHV